MPIEIEFEDMVFFDNERRNIRTVEPLGVTCIYTPDGMTQALYDEGMSKFAARVSEKR